eukprot:CAMPEP_0197585456 /NCGR_PEP_ID=MMETSP1326-20131121/7754_1 /TAXON_ID=1155430 /ORGANISM="Genus nov. species nov., Strain RCC2288" /LENGTH=276 /DNA_ID=CAMNT_0043149963 /DNA_START=70 /DNA_END=903 /DNA_ORIENTATION=+
MSMTTSPLLSTPGAARVSACVRGSGGAIRVSRAFASPQQQPPSARRQLAVSARSVGTGKSGRGGKAGGGGSSGDEGEGGSSLKEVLTSRRAILVGKTLFTVGEAFIFPWATESRTRPPSPGDEDLTPFSPAWLKSLLYSESDPEAKARGKATLARGEELAAEGRYTEAVALLETVPGIAPKEYKMVQRAYLQLEKCNDKLGQPEVGNEWSSKVWWWGRGTRWPGWYIIAYLSGRSLFFTAKEDNVGSFTVTEGLVFLVPIWIGLLYVLTEYGIPDY